MATTSRRPLPLVAVGNCDEHHALKYPTDQALRDGLETALDLPGTRAVTACTWIGANRP
jgi:hypothetical protein